jgi:hypothetical protein
MLHFRDSYSIGMYGATTLASFLPYSSQGWLALTGTLPEYQSAADRIIEEIRHPHPNDPPSCWNEIRAGIARSRVDAEVAVGHDTDSPPFLTNWHSVVQMFGLGASRESRSKALLVFAFGGQSLQPELLADGRSLYTIHFQIAAWERASGQKISIDTTRRFVRPTPLSPTEVLTSWLEVPLPPGLWEVALRAMQQYPGAGTFALRRDVAVVRETTFAVSEIVTGMTGGMSWRPSDGTSFPLNPLGVWPAASNAEIYFEVYGLTERQSFKTTIDVRSEDPANKQSVSISSIDFATGPVTSIRRSLGLERLPPGRYVMTVTLEYGSSRVTRSQRIEVNAPK